MKIARIESIPLRIPFTAGGPSGAGAGLQTVDSFPQSAGLGIEPRTDVIRDYRLA
jgi:hypothetical protein